MALGGGGHILVSVGNLLHVIFMFSEQFPAQHDANFFQYGVVSMDTLLFFLFIVMMHAFNCSVYFNNIILSCEVIPLVCLHFYVNR